MGTGTRIVFPSESDKDCEIITIMGKKEDVERAKEQLEKLIMDLVSAADEGTHIKQLTLYALY